jgi:hypothetical protein
VCTYQSSRVKYYTPVVSKCAQNRKAEFNPDSTGWGQNWPCQLWRQIPDKPLIYRNFFKIYLFLQKLLPNLFELLMWPQKMMFRRQFFFFFCHRFSLDALLRTPPLLSGFTAITDHLSIRKVRPGPGPQCSAAPVSIRSVSDPRPRRVRGGRQVLCCAHCLSLSECTNVAATFWVDFWNCSALLTSARYQQRWFYIRES